MNDKIILPNEFLSLAEENLKEGKSVKILADGSSMKPFILGGKDYAEIFPLMSEEKPELWQAYLFKYGNKYIIHRYIENKGGKYVMMGDGNLDLIEEVNRENIIGLLKFIHKGEGGIVDCTTKKWRRKGKTWNRLLPFRRYLLSAFYRLNLYGLMR